MSTIAETPNDYTKIVHMNELKVTHRKQSGRGGYPENSPFLIEMDSIDKRYRKFYRS